MVFYNIIVASNDYTEPGNPVRFPRCAMQHCVEITITDDNVLEPLESFTVSLRRSRSFGNKIRLEPDGTEIEIVIIDDDGMFKNFVPCRGDS